MKSEKCDITPDVWQWARQLATQIEGTGLFKTPNYTGLARDDRFVIGYAGEWVFREWLTQNNVKHDYRVKTDGRSQRSEFIVWREGQPKAVEVKTASKAHYRKLMWPAAQAMDWAAVVGVRISGNLGEVMGWLQRQDIESRTSIMPGVDGVPTRQVDYEELRAPSEFVSMVETILRG